MKGIIYCWTNKTNGKRYIGQTYREKKRRYDHIYLSKKKKGWLSAFHTALREVGYDGFEYNVLFKIETDDLAVLKHTLDEKEAYYIRKYKSCLTEFGYNETIDGQYQKSIFNDSGNQNKRTKIVKKKQKVVEVNIQDKPLSKRQKEILDMMKHLCEGMHVPMPSVEWTDNIRPLYKQS